MSFTFHPITKDMTSQGNLFPKIMKTIKKAGVFAIIKIPSTSSNIFNASEMCLCTILSFQSRTTFALTN